MGSVPSEFVQGGGYFGPTFTAVFFFENIFWRMVIPIVYGSGVQVNVLDSLVAMPAQIRRRLAQKEATRQACVLHWADCIDYDQGMNEFLIQPPPHPAVDLVLALDRDLRSTIADLAQEEPNSNAMHNACLTTEKALKAYLCFRHGYTVEGLKKQFSHNVAALAAKVVEREPNAEIAAVGPRTTVFAPYGDRYTQMAYSRPQLWHAYASAQFAASSLIRSLTSYNQRAAITTMLKHRGR